METRNAVRNADGSVTCEVEHDLYGWIPFTARDGDAESQGIWDSFQGTSLPDADPDPVPVPQSVTDIQFALASVTLGLMTAQEAEDWVGAGVLPAAVNAALAGVQDPQTLAAIRIRIRGARVIERNNSVIDLLRVSLGLTEEQVDAIFVSAAAL